MEITDLVKGDLDLLLYIPRLDHLWFWWLNWFN